MLPTPYRGSMPAGSCRWNERPRGVATLPPVPRFRSHALTLGSHGENSRESNRSNIYDDTDFSTTFKIADELNFTCTWPYLVCTVELSLETLYS
jgi:hypothetical protein